MQQINGRITPPPTPTPHPLHLHCKRRGSTYPCTGDSDRTWVIDNESFCNLTLRAFLSSLVCANTAIFTQREEEEEPGEPCVPTRRPFAVLHPPFFFPQLNAKTRWSRFPKLLIVNPRLCFYFLVEMCSCFLPAQTLLYLGARCRERSAGQRV